jgi:hypothetical protein
MLVGCYQASFSCGRPHVDRPSWFNAARLHLLACCCGATGVDSVQNMSLLAAFVPQVGFVPVVPHIPLDPLPVSSKVPVLLVKAGERGVETSPNKLGHGFSGAGWHARMSSRQR